MEDKNESGERALLRMFMHDAQGWPLLSREEETIVARRARAGDKAAADLLVESNLRFVYYIVLRYWRPGMPMMDMVSEGCLALLDALKNFDPDRGVKFISYAGKGVKQNVCETIRLHYRHKHKSLDEPVYDDGDETTYKDLLISKDPGADEAVFRQQILNMLSGLDERERRVLYFHFWGDLTLKEAGAKIGVSKDQVQQIANKALRKLRWMRSGDSGMDPWRGEPAKESWSPTSNVKMEVMV